MSESLQDQLTQLSHLLMDATVLADDIRKRINQYPDTSSTERSEAGVLARDLASVYGKVQYLGVAFRKVNY